MMSSLVEGSIMEISFGYYRLNHLLVVVPFLLYACDGDLQSSNSPELSLSTDQLIFTAPESLSETSTLTLSVSNSGQSTLIINSIELIEDDMTPEVEIVDEEDWTSEAFRLEAGVTRMMTLIWTPTNQQADSGQLTFVTNAGTRVVTFRTADLDPLMSLKSDGPAELGQNGGVIQLKATSATPRPTAHLTIQCTSFTPLTITQLCFVDSDLSCLNPIGEVGRGQLSLCERVNEDECVPFSPLNAPITLLSGEERSFYLQYRPVNGEIDAVAGRVKVESDSVSGRNYYLQVQGLPCEECEGEGGDMAGDTAGDIAGFMAGDTAGFMAGDTAGLMAGDTAGDVAGDTAGLMAGDTAGDTAGDMAGDSAGDMAGDSAGDMAGDTAGDTAGDMAGEVIQEVDFRMPGIHIISIPIEINEIEVWIWGGGGAGGNQLGATGGGAAAALFTYPVNDSQRELLLWVGEGGAAQGEGGGGSFLFNAADMSLLAAVGGGGGGASDGNSGRSWSGGGGGAGGWPNGRPGQDLGPHQAGTTYPMCVIATGGRGGTQSEAGLGGTRVGTASGCDGGSGSGQVGGSVTSRGLSEYLTCHDNLDRAGWNRAPSQGNGGGGGGGGGHFGGGSGAFVMTYCGGGGGGGSSWLSPLMQMIETESGQSEQPGLIMLSDESGQGGQRVSVDTPGDLSFQGQAGRILLRW